MLNDFKILNISSELIQRIKAIMNHTKSVARVNNEQTEPVVINNDVGRKYAC